MMVPPPPMYYAIFGQTKLSYGSDTLDMTSVGFGEMFEGDSSDMCAGKFSLISMGGRANGQVCADGEGGPPST